MQDQCKQQLNNFHVGKSEQVMIETFQPILQLNSKKDKNEIFEEELQSQQELSWNFFENLVKAKKLINNIKKLAKVVN